ncbi:hypothetical protein BGP84_18735 [Pseudomonas putida]|jgi:hypothetical protein|uniref:Uncharacterized protein n=1 Tax=Pseudomonas putida TaxID=303 RepID=A0A2S3WV76_PSEPU|nr:hypothetical protein [Pseudomonas putida]POG04934.1 hypothetical protein BGP84_18735 [Pseudomonas putida]POG07668.1 hypothetical protein BGP85_12775 [Pseudomonas putida]
MAKSSQKSMRDLLLQQYDKEIGASYDKQFMEFMSYLSRGGDNPKAICGRCGAECGAAHKRAKRGLVIAALEREKEAGMDITPTVAGHVFERLIGRGMDDRAASAHFATPGRTAANKSTLTAEDFAELEARLAGEVVELMDKMEEIRERHRDIYRDRVKAATAELVTS